MFDLTEEQKAHNEAVKELLGLIVDKQAAATNLDIHPTVGGIVSHQYVRVYSAPPVVVKMIMERYPLTSLERGSLLIRPSERRPDTRPDASATL